MNRIFLFLIISFVFIASCKNNTDKDLRKIKELEKAIVANTSAPMDIEKAKELINTYIDFAKKYPKDTNSVNFLFKAASMSMNISLPNLSIELFDRIIKEYPSYKRVPECLFMKAFIYDDKLKNINKASEAYEMFLKKYPAHDFADDAKACLDNLGKTTEQLIQEFEAKQKSDSLTIK